jgi:hypothetical protein
MHIGKAVLNLVNTLVMVFVGFYLVVSLCILGLKLTGRLGDGPMYFEMQTPGYAQLLLFQAASIAALCAGAYFRRLLKQAPPTRSKPEAR